jgi:hypothetical protein
MRTKDGTNLRETAEGNGLGLVIAYLFVHMGSLVGVDCKAYESVTELSLFEGRTISW